MYSHVGFRRQVGHVHSGRLYGHGDYRGRSHALTGSGNIYSGGIYKALCGKIVVADHDGYGFNLTPIAGMDGAGVSCRRCRRIINKGV